MVVDCFLWVKPVRTTLSNSERNFSSAEGENIGFKTKGNSEIVELNELEEYKRNSSDDKDKLKEEMMRNLSKVEYMDIINSTKFISAGRSHLFLITNSNSVYTAG